MKGMPNDWLIEGLDKSYQILVLILEGVSQEQAQSISDGPEGWNVLEILCHLRDYQEIFFERIKQILDVDNPTFRLYEENARLAMVVENDYANQDLRHVLDNYCSTRRDLIDCLSPLQDEQWERVGSFAVDDEVDLAMPVVHVLLHDADHIEQIGRILRQ